MTPTVCIDAGHGGHDPGAMGPGGLRESEMALNVALVMGSLLAGKCHVIYTRQTNVFLTLTERAMIANRQNADAFVSIHCNSGPPGQGKGFEVWTYPGQTASDWLATDLFNAYAAEFPTLTKRMDTSDGDIDKESPFTVLQKTNMAAALFELEFIHTEAGEAWLEDVMNRKRAAEALARGVVKYLKLDSQAVTPPVAVPVPVADPHNALELAAVASLDRFHNKVAEAETVFRTELEAIFRKS